MLFTLLDGLYSKQETCWKLGKVLEVEERRVRISYVVRIPKIGNPIMAEVFRNFRDVSVIYSVNDIFINTTEHFFNANQNCDIPGLNSTLTP